MSSGSSWPGLPQPLRPHQYRGTNVVPTPPGGGRVTWMRQCVQSTQGSPRCIQQGLSRGRISACPGCRPGRLLLTDPGTRSPRSGRPMAGFCCGPASDRVLPRPLLRVYAWNDSSLPLRVRTRVPSQDPTVATSPNPNLLQTPAFWRSGLQHRDLGGRTHSAHGTEQVRPTCRPEGCSAVTPGPHRHPR